MAEWIELPRDPLYYQRDQVNFLDARRERFCLECKKVFQALPETPLCPKCRIKGERVWDRMTIMAGRRFGKSLAGSMAGAEEACFPGTIGWACAPTIPKLHRYVIPAFQRLIPKDWVLKWDSELKDLWLKNKSLIHFQTLEDPDQGRGQGLDWLWIDEVCELREEHWNVIRPSLAGDTVAFFTTTPKGKDWVYKQLYQPATEGVPGYWACHSKTSESANPRVNADFLAREKQLMTDEWYRQEYEADFVSFEGAIYGALVQPQIIRKENEIEQMHKLGLTEWPKLNPSRTLYVGLDEGADHPFGAAFGVYVGDNIVWIGEYLQRDRTFQDHVAYLKRWSAENYTKWAINKNARQPMIELARLGVNCVPAENEQLAGTQRIKTFLQNRRMWFVESRVPRLISQMESLKVAPPRADKQSTGKLRQWKVDDELADCVRYATWMLPEPEPVSEADEASTERDLSAYPAHVQAEILRMREYNRKMIEGDKYYEVASGVGEFWA